MFGGDAVDFAVLMRGAETLDGRRHLFLLLRLQDLEVVVPTANEVFHSQSVTERDIAGERMERGEGERESEREREIAR